jgi:DedD protein
MAFFKFRKGGDATPATPAQAESVEVLRRRARHRLIGAAVLVLIGVIGFPLLFDTQPRPVAVDIPIEIPDRNKAKPLPMPPPRRPSTEGLPSPRRRSSAPADRAKAEGRSRARAQGRSAQAGSQSPKPVAKAPLRHPPRRRPKPAGRALLEGKPVQAEAREAAAESRFVVQVGAFADATKAREARQKVEKAGLKTYTNVAETKDGGASGCGWGRSRPRPRPTRRPSEDQGTGFAGRRPHLVSRRRGAARLGVPCRAARLVPAGAAARAGVRGALGDELAGGLRAGTVAGTAGGQLVADGAPPSRCATPPGSRWCSSWRVFAGGLVAWGCASWSRPRAAAGGPGAGRRMFGLVRGVVLLLAAAVVVNMTPLRTAAWWTESMGAGVATAALKGLKPVLPERFGQYLPG